MNQKKEFYINNFITLKLEDNKSKIYINGILFRQCKHLLLINPQEQSNQTQIKSIDEAASLLCHDLDYNLEPLTLGITPEEEFWAHCSNIQIWYENDYDTRLIHSNLAFPLLKRLYEAGDVKAIRVFREEIVKRFNSNFLQVKEYLIEENYLDFLNSDEISVALENMEDELYLYGIEKFPNYLFEARKLKTLIIRVSKIHDIPEKLCKLDGLKNLNLIKCKIRNLPETMHNFKSLEELNLSQNELRSIPKTIGKINSLKEFKIRGNFLSNLPDTMKDLTKLNTLDISENNFSSLPETVFKIKSLKNLFINNNKINKIQKSISCLKNLQALDLNMNQLTELPDTLGDLCLLENLYVGYNNLKYLPESIGEIVSLRHVTIAGNKFKRIPKFILELPMLTELTVDIIQKDMNITLLRKKKEENKNLFIRVLTL